MIMLFPLRLRDSPLMMERVYFEGTTLLFRLEIREKYAYPIFQYDGDKVLIPNNNVGI